MLKGDKLDTENCKVVVLKDGGGEAKKSSVDTLGVINKKEMKRRMFR